MSRIKALAAMLLLLPALASAESPNLISPDKMQAEVVSYKTQIVESGTYVRSYSASPTTYYPYLYNLRVQVSDAKFVKYLVERGQEVKAGDPLVEFSLETDEVAMASLRQKLERLQESYGQELANREESIAALTDELNAQNDPLQRQLITLRIQRAQTALEQYCYQQEKAIANAQEDIADMEAEASANTLVAPYDGVIDDLVFMRQGDRVSVGQKLITLSRTDTMLFRIDNKNGYFRYGMDVVLETGNLRDRVQVPARVVGADTLLPENRRTNYAYIALESPMPEGRQMRMSVTANTYYLDNVLIIPRSAVELINGKYQVQRLVNGVTQTRGVNSPLTMTSQIWILQGLEEGDEILIN